MRPPLPAALGCLQAVKLLQGVHACCSNLGRAAQQLVRNRPATISEAGSSQIEAIVEAGVVLVVAMRLPPFSSPPPPSLATLRQYQGLVVHAATELAARLQAYCELLELLQVDRLAAARAAAARSCAYLRCANLGGEGGARAGTGAGSKKCMWEGRVERHPLLSCAAMCHRIKVQQCPALRRAPTT